MESLSKSYQVPELPDPFYPPYLLAAGGDARSSIWQGFAQVLRCVSHLPPASVCLSLVIAFSPEASAAAAQSRVSVYILSRAEDANTAATLALLLERGPVAPYYDLRLVQSPPVPWARMTAVYHVVRREDAIEPIHSSEFNDRIPPLYYAIHPFCANEKNDYLLLDHVLDKLGQSAAVEIAVSPIDVSTELAEHTRYLARLASINRSWDRDDDESGQAVDYLGSGQTWRAGAAVNLRPLRREDPLADDILRRQRRFHETLILPNLSFRIRALAETASTANLVASVVAESAFDEGAYRLLACAAECENPACSSGLSAAPFSSLERLFGREPARPYAGLARLAHVASVDELTGAFRLPVASHGSPCCIRKNTDPVCEDETDLIVLGFDQEPAAEGGTSSGVPRGVPVGGLAKHAFIGGVPGVGKTTSGVNLAAQANERGIPCLILEAVKTEYRQLKPLKNRGDSPLHRLASELRVYTPGNEAVSPFRFNPMWIRTGIGRDEHIDNRLQCFNAAMPMSGPLPALLREAYERVYDEYPDRGDPPVIGELFTATERVLASKGYSPETNSDIRAALEVRLGMLTHGSIGRMFQCPENMPDIDDLLASPTVIELDNLAREQACLTTLFILTAIREWAKTTPSDQAVRLVVFIEEAHLLVGRSTDASPSEVYADPKAHAAESIVRMLAEFRAMGVAIVILDQLPSAVAPEVIKNTSLKLAYRQVAREDREELGATMLFSPLETEEIARLQPGEAYFYREGYHGPRRIRTVNPFEGVQRGTPLLNEAIVPYLRDEPWFAQTRLGRQEAELAQLRREMDRFDSERLGFIRRAAELVAAYPRVLARRGEHRRSDGLRRLLQQTRALRGELAATFDLFTRRPYRSLLGPDDDANGAADDEFRNALIRRFDSVVAPDTQACLGKLDGLATRCAAKLRQLEGV